MNIYFLMQFQNKYCFPYFKQPWITTKSIADQDVTLTDSPCARLYFTDQSFLSYGLTYKQLALKALTALCKMYRSDTSVYTPALRWIHRQLESSY